MHHIVGIPCVILPYGLDPIIPRLSVGLVASDGVIINALREYDKILAVLCIYL